MPQDSRHCGETGVQDCASRICCRSVHVNEGTVFVGPAVVAELGDSMKLDTEFHGAWRSQTMPRSGESNRSAQMGPVVFCWCCRGLRTRGWTMSRSLHWAGRCYGSCPRNQSTEASVRPPASWRDEPFRRGRPRKEMGKGDGP